MRSPSLRQPSPRARRAAVVFFALVLGTSGTSGAADPDETMAKPPGYVGTPVCVECHGAEGAAWDGSDHDWAMRTAASGNVLGDFDNAEFEHFEVTSRFFRRDGRYFVLTEGPAGKQAEFEIKYTVGVAPLQQYLIELEGGFLQALSIAWDVQSKRWFHLYPEQRIPPDDGLHWTGVYQNWNGRCAECHSTNYDKGYDPRTRSYSSSWTDMNVGCEACHGPGEAHVAWAKAPDSYDTSGFVETGPTGLTVDLSAPYPKTETEVCAACHARRQSLSSRSRAAGSRFLDDFVPSLLREGLYHADGQILDEVYVYGSFLQSKMHAKGVRCTDCHEPHRLDTRAEGNALCTQCHGPDGNPRFSNLKPGLFDSPLHHFHAQGGEGAKCANCHMPARTYMVVDPRRDHSFRVPRPDLSVRLGTPNACTLCHAEKSDTWALGQVQAWYPEGRSGRPHFSEVLSAGRARDPDAPNELIALAHEAAQPAIVRATALDLLRAYGPTQIDAAIDLLADPEPLVRRSAATLQEHATPRARLARLVPLLKDPRRSVRIEAARQLADVPVREIPRDARPAIEAGFAEYQATLRATVDLPETQMNLAGLAYRTGNLRAAEAALRTALNMDRHFEEAWLRLGELQHTMGRIDDAEATLRAGLTIVAESGPLQNGLGLLLGERGELAEAAEHLESAVALMPDDSRVRYNLGLALERLGRTDAAELALHDALHLAPTDPDILYALGVHYLSRGRLDEAEARGRELDELHPDRPQGRWLLDEIVRRRASSQRRRM